MNILIGIYIFILGTVFASFFGVVIDRVPQDLNIVTLPSRCDNCGHQLKWYENIPILSYIFLGGKCSSCKTKIGSFLLVLELIGGVSLLLVYLKYGLTIECLFICLITLMMLLIGGFDYKTNLILNIFLYILIGLNVTLFIYRVLVLKNYYLDYLFSALLGLVFFLSLKLIMSKILKKDALGTGDIWLVTIMGLCFSPFEHILALTVGSLVGSIISIILIKLSKTQREAEIAFCPYLCLGYYVIFIFGNVLTNLLVG